MGVLTDADKEIQKRPEEQQVEHSFPGGLGILRPPTAKELTGTQSVEKKGQYIAEKTKYGEWTAHFHKPITGSFLSHVQTAMGIDSAQGLKRHSMMIYVARMHQHNAAEVIANAIESYKE